MVRVLLVEDDPAIAKIIHYYLSECKEYEIKWAQNASQAIELCGANTDVILLDIMLPDINGIDLCARLRRKIYCPIIFISCLDDEETIVRALETGGDEALYTLPEQVPDFLARSGCDSLAVSIGTAHGVYPVKDPKIDFDRLKKIRALTNAPLVLHGGSGLPAQTVHRAIALDGIGGIAKINIATDLELAFQKELGVTRMPNAELLRLPREELERGAAAVQALVEDRIENYLFASNQA